MKLLTKSCYHGYLLVVICSVHSITHTTAEPDCFVSPGIPSVWLGEEDNSTFCKAQPSHCAHFGLDFICENPTGGSKTPCVTGSKVLCSSPPAVPLDDPTPASDIRIVTYNIWELRYLYYQNGQRERTCRIINELVGLRQDIDVIVFNEAFMGGCFSSFNSSVDTETLTIREILDQYGFVHHTTNVGEDRGLPKFENGGVFIASRWPITAEEDIIYTQGTNEDILSAKGCMYARVVKTVDDVSRTYHVFGSHMQAGKGNKEDGIRLSQATEMRSFMLNLNLPTDEPVIYAGDFNVDYHDGPGSHADDVLGTLNAIVPPIIGKLNFTTDGKLNDARDGNSESFKDYVIYDADYLPPLSASQEILRPRAPDYVEVCMKALSTYPTYPGSERCLESQNITDLSDHFPVIGVYFFEGHNLNTSMMPPTMTTDSSAFYWTMRWFHIMAATLLTIVLM